MIYTLWEEAISHVGLLHMGVIETVCYIVKCIYDSMVYIRGYIIMTYNEAMRLAISSCDGTMDDLNRIAQGLMCKVDTIAEWETSEEEKFNKDHNLGWYEYY